MRCRIILPIVVLATVVSAFVGLKLSIYFYTTSLEIRLNPTHLGLFTSANWNLSHRVQGEKKIVLFGDSRMERWKNPPSLSRYEIINRGVGGDTTAQAMLRLEQDVIALAPDVVVIQIGINDLKAIGVMPEKRDWIIERAKSNIKLMTTLLERNDIQVLLMTVLPSAEPGMIQRLVWFPEIGRAASAINHFIRSLESKHVSIMDCSPVFDVDDRMRSVFVLDTTHINEKGYDALGKLLETSFVTMAATEAELQN